MDRRTFAQRVALAAGALGLAQPDQPAQAAEAPADKGAKPAARPAEIAPGGPREPVSVDDFQALSAAALPKATYEYITTGSCDEFTLRENIAAFRRIKILPPLLRGVSQVDTATTALGQPISLPIMLAPVACQSFYHPQGALASSRAAHAAGTIYGVSSSVGHSVEEIAAASQGPKWFQLYVPKDLAVARQLVQRVEKAGYQAIIVTVDLGEWKDADRRNNFALPKKMLVKHLRDTGFDQISDRMSEAEVRDFNINAWDISLSWKFFDWLRDQTKLPILMKGVLRKADAEQAMAIGLEGVIVSNHGGRRLDGMPATIDRLSEVAAAVGDRAEVYLDSGIRRGTDVLKALALGARAVLIGRPYVWALSAQGEAGVRKVIELLRAELHNAMIATGCAKLSDIDRSLLITSTTEGSPP